MAQRGKVNKAGSFLFINVVLPNTNSSVQVKFKTINSHLQNNENQKKKNIWLTQGYMRMKLFKELLWWSFHNYSLTTLLSWLYRLFMLDIEFNVMVSVGGQVSKQLYWGETVFDGNFI